MFSIKEQLYEIIKNQPDDSSYDEILRELAFARMVERGLADSQANRTITNDEMKKKIQSWQK
jgi:predicted transcriptional regulator